jgi:hypothetical protein
VIRKCNLIGRQQNDPTKAKLKAVHNTCLNLDRILGDNDSERAFAHRGSWGGAERLKCRVNHACLRGWSLKSSLPGNG